MMPEINALTYVSIAAMTGWVFVAAIATIMLARSTIALMRQKWWCRDTEKVRDPRKLWARDLTDDELVSEMARVEVAWERIRSADEGGGGSPGEWAWERMAELNGEMKRRGIPTPAREEENKG